MLTTGRELDEQITRCMVIHQKWASIIKKYLDLQELDRETIDELIDHIEIGERTVIDGQKQQDIKIFYRFVGEV
nr:DUF4368 domain-containing protein [uncultured Acetatifactor sp.]